MISRLRILAAGFLLCALICAAAPARAADDAKPQATPRADHLPDFCEFTVDFPEEPMIARRCADAEGTDCYTTANFTRVYDLETSVGVHVSCNKADPGMTARYSEDVMKKTLESMARNKPVKNYTLNATTKDWGKAATLFGEGTKGMSSTLYVAQIWVGKDSVFTVEGELSGKVHDESDALFSSILKSIRPLSVPAEKEPEQNPAPEQPKKEGKK